MFHEPHDTDPVYSFFLLCVQSVTTGNLFCFASDHLQKDRGLHSHAGPAHEEGVSSKKAEETQM